MEPDKLFMKLAEKNKTNLKKNQLEKGRSCQITNLRKLWKLRQWCMSAEIDKQTKGME